MSEQILIYLVFSQDKLTVSFEYHATTRWLMSLESYSFCCSSTGKVREKWVLAREQFWRHFRSRNEVVRSAGIVLALFSQTKMTAANAVLSLCLTLSPSHYFYVCLSLRRVSVRWQFYQEDWTDVCSLKESKYSNGDNSNMHTCKLVW